MKMWLIECWSCRKPGSVSSRDDDAAAEPGVALQHEDLLAGGRQVGGSHEAVVAGADGNDVGGSHCSHWFPVFFCLRLAAPILRSKRDGQPLRNLRDPLRPPGPYGNATISSAATPTTGRCRSTTTSGRSAAAAAYWLLDTGFDAATGAARGRQLVQPVEDGLRAIGVEPAVGPRRDRQPHALRPCGQPRPVPATRATTCRPRRWRFCTGSAMCHAAMRATYEAADVQAMVGKLFADRVVFHDGDGANSRPASDAAPGRRPYAWPAGGARAHAARLGGAGLGRGAFLRQLAAASAVSDRRQRGGLPRCLPHHRARWPASPQHVIPGHDPLVLERYPLARPGVANAVRLDLPPLRPVP